jgi:hypothetical protein
MVVEREAQQQTLSTQGGAAPITAEDVARIVREQVALMVVPTAATLTRTDVATMLQDQMAEGKKEWRVEMERGLKTTQDTLMREVEKGASKFDEQERQLSSIRSKVEKSEDKLDQILSLLMGGALPKAMEPQNMQGSEGRQPGASLSGGGGALERGPSISPEAAEVETGAILLEERRPVVGQVSSQFMDVEGRARTKRRYEGDETLAVKGVLGLGPGYIRFSPLREVTPCECRKEGRRCLAPDTTKESGEDPSICMSYSHIVCGPGCCGWMDEDRPDKCDNRLTRLPRVEKFEDDRGLGRGLRAAEDIEDRQIITELNGRSCKSTSTAAVEARSKGVHAGSIFHYEMANTDWTVVKDEDPADGWSINATCSNKRKNCSFQETILPGGRVAVLVVASKPIRSGEVLWTRYDLGGTCLCGAEGCQSNPVGVNKPLALKDLYARVAEWEKIRRKKLVEMSPAEIDAEFTAAGQVFYPIISRGKMTPAASIAKIVKDGLANYSIMSMVKLGAAETASMAFADEHIKRSRYYFEQWLNSVEGRTINGDGWAEAMTGIRGHLGEMARTAEQVRAEIGDPVGMAIAALRAEALRVAMAVEKLGHRLDSLDEITEEALKLSRVDEPVGRQEAILVLMAMKWGEDGSYLPPAGRPKECGEARLLCMPDKAIGVGVYLRLKWWREGAYPEYTPIRTDTSEESGRNRDTDGDQDI